MKYLKQRENSEKIALLLLSGKIEHYVVRDFAFLLNKSSNGIYSGFINVGRRKPKVDLVIIDKYEIVQAFMEFKHIPDKNRFWNDKSTGRDNIGKSLKDLYNQLRKVDVSKSKFEATNNKVFQVSKGASSVGMVVVSYYGTSFSHDSMKDFFYKIVEKADRMGFKNYGRSDLTLDEIFSNLNIAFAGKKYSVTLKLGLWHVPNC